MHNLLTIENITLCLRKRSSLFGHTESTILSNITLPIVKGETLGIIGRNGCGKSTLLRVIAGIYTPDQGSIQKSNDISVSLLTLGAGFDPNLSGYDNALLSSMLMGFSKKKSLAKMADIIEFSELGESIHQPVRSYSTGMKARLGFSIGVQINPDILLIDEVLGVGDLGFREKAEQVLQAKINSEQTVVLVSHNLEVIQKLSNQVAWIDQGSLVMHNTPSLVIGKYIEFMQK